MTRNDSGRFGSASSQARRLEAGHDTAEEACRLIRIRAAKGGVGRRRLPGPPQGRSPGQPSSEQWRKVGIFLTMVHRQCGPVRL